MCAGLSGRMLRKLPVLAFARLVQAHGTEAAGQPVPLDTFIRALVTVVAAEQDERKALSGLI